jgi:hypothetical protein
LTGSRSSSSPIPAARRRGYGTALLPGPAARRLRHRAATAPDPGRAAWPAAAAADCGRARPGAVSAAFLPLAISTLAIPSPFKET